MEKTCLTCKYEPDWSEWFFNEPSTRSGKCKWKNCEPWPKVYSITERRVMQHKGKSQFKKCDAWESKGE